MITLLVRKLIMLMVLPGNHPIHAGGDSLYRLMENARQDAQVAVTLSEMRNIYTAWQRVMVESGGLPVPPERLLRFKMSGSLTVTRIQTDRRPGEDTVLRFPYRVPCAELSQILSLPRMSQINGTDAWGTSLECYFSDAKPIPVFLVRSAGSNRWFETNHYRNGPGTDEGGSHHRDILLWAGGIIFGPDLSADVQDEGNDGHVANPDLPAPIAD